MNNAQPVANTPTVTASTLNFEVWGATDLGRASAHNEDTIWPEGMGAPLASDSYLLVVADGVGGSQDGEVASRIVVNEIVRCCENAPVIDPVQTLYQAVQVANTAVYNYVSGSRMIDQAASTVVAALVKDSQVHVASVGDSRAYLIQNGAAEQLTQDHTLTQQKVNLGRLPPEQAPYDQDRNVITRSLGSAPTVTVDINFTGVRTLQPGDTLLLCSDGLTDVLSGEDIARFVGRRSPRQATKRLIKEANRRGGPDNISVVMGRVPGPGSQFNTMNWPYILLGLGGLLFLLACTLLLGGLFLPQSPHQAVVQVTPVVTIRGGITTAVPSILTSPTPTRSPTPEPSPRPTTRTVVTSTPLPPPTQTTAVVAIAASPTQLIITVTPTPISSQPDPSPTLEVPAPTLKDPPDGASIFRGTKAEFKWTWESELSDDQGFEIRLWHENDTVHNRARDIIPGVIAKSNRQHDRIYVSSFTIDGAESVQLHGPGNYRWTVVVVDLETNDSISPEAASRKLIYE